MAANVAGGELNVAGPRASQHPGVYEKAKALLVALFAARERVPPVWPGIAV